MATVTRESIGLLNDKITVKVAKEDYLNSFEKSLKKYGKTANIPGFRKGMVPAGMIKKMQGQAVFADEVFRTVEKELSNYMVNEKLEIFAQPLPMPENDARQLDMNNPAEYEFAFEVGLKPAFDVADLANEKVKKYVVTVTDEMLNQEIERQQLRHGKLTDREEVSDNDDVLNVVFVESDETGKEIEGGIRKDNSLLVKYFAEAFRPKLIGKKKDDTITLKLGEALEGKEKQWVSEDLGLKADDEATDAKYFNMMITKIGHVERAGMNEEFFKAAYPSRNIQSEDEYRNIVKEEIQSYWEGQSKNQLQHEIYHRLLDHTRIEFPETFLKRWMQTGNNEQQKSQEQVEHDYPSFSNQLKWTLITDKIVQDQKFNVDPEDLKKFAKSQLFGYMQMNVTDEEQPWITEYVNRMMQDQKFVEDAYHRILTEKVFDWAETVVQKNETPVNAEDFTKMIQEHQHHHHH